MLHGRQDHRSVVSVDMRQTHGALDRLGISRLQLSDYHTWRKNAHVRILSYHVRRGEEGRGQHRGSPNEGDGTAAPPLDAGNARRTTTIQYPRLLRSSVLPENLLPVDIGTPPIIILEMLVISIILASLTVRPHGGRREFLPGNHVLWVGREAVRAGH